tara:strand:- start:3356 stop:3487 length:132 start_codon:yes stop_codon:yes gene_type:complete
MEPTKGKIKKIVGELKKASKLHAGQAKRLETILSVMGSAENNG